MHDFDARHKYLLHRPVVNLSPFQRGVYYSGYKSLTDCHQKLLTVEAINHHCRTT
jgi:hypothetical protein